MTDWDLLMPGAGLTAVGAIGVAVALSGIAKTFMDGMHAVSILLMFIGLIFLSAGLFKDGFPTSKKIKSCSGHNTDFIHNCWNDWGFTSQQQGSFHYFIYCHYSYNKYSFTNNNNRFL